MPGGLTVVVLNWQRPGLIDRALRALERQSDPDFDVIVVSDVAPAPDWAVRVRWRTTESPGVAAARNLALAQPGEEIVAFLDDDAVPHPGWVAALRSAFGPRTVAAGGPVLGPDGVRLQWGRLWVNRCGEEGAERPGAVLKLNGTNMALRRSAVEAAGGFNPAFAYYLDDTDMVLRLSDLGAIAWVPDAVVQHGTEANGVRARAGVPTAMTPLLDSLGTFLDIHAPGERDAALDRFRDHQRARIRRAYGAGDLREGTVARLMSELDEAPRPPRGPPPSPNLQAHPPSAFGAKPPARSVILVPDILSRAAARRDAATMAAEAAVRLLEMRFSPRRLVVRFTAEGWWYHLGGAYERPQSWRTAVARELERMLAERPAQEILRYRRGRRVGGP